MNRLNLLVGGEVLTMVGCVVMLAVVLFVRGSAFAGETEENPHSNTYYLGWSRGYIPDDAIEVELSEPFVISQTDSEMRWFPALRQISPSKLVVTFSSSPDTLNPEVSRSGYVVTEDGGQTWSEPTYQTVIGGPCWVLRKDGSSLNLNYTLTYESESVASLPVGRSTDGIHFDWSTRSTIDFAPLKLKPEAEGVKGITDVVSCRSLLRDA